MIYGVLDVYSQVRIFFKLLEMVSGKPLFTGTSEADQLKRIFKIRGTPNEKTYPDIVKLSEWNVNIKRYFISLKTMKITKSKTLKNMFLNLRKMGLNY